jgi:hypothetical protein
MNYMFLHHPEKYIFAVPTTNRDPFDKRIALALPDPVLRAAHLRGMHMKPTVVSRQVTLFK